MIYLDNAATSFPKSEKVYQAIDYAGRSLGVNAGRGSYALAREAADLIQHARNELKNMIKAEGVAEVVFTASATVAFNAIIGGIRWQGNEVVYVSPYEHNAVMRTLYGYQQKYHFSVRELPLREDLSVDIEKTVYQFAQTPPDYLFCNLLSNVTGYVLPAKEVVACAKLYDCTVVLDGAQALGTMPVDFRDLGADFLVFAGHKALGGPFGVGGYLKQGEGRLQPFLFGGTGSNSLLLDMPKGQERYEPGSPNIVAIAGLHAALLEQKELSVQQENWEKERRKAGYLLGQLREISGLTVYQAPPGTDQAGILSVNLEGYRSDEIGMLLDQDYGIAVRTGYHCAPLIHRYLQDDPFRGTVRISVGRFTTEKDMDLLIRALKEIAEE